ncbi:F-box protein [Actinidia chinensis var. chinensis]|uniref:F-box protein n=1 Tax=Actinidia chinensis var. chinensis TaxID=1590841 RepID=A0A2R6QA94_ACTCC|nr:F-box protein [Actinidia chinensis var. chinensis]
MNLQHHQTGFNPNEKEKQVCNRERKRENESSSTPSNGHFPYELIENILLQISVKNLLRYKCVSKSWHTLIDDIYFVKKHLEYNVKSNTNLGLIVQEDADDSWMQTVHLDDMVGHDQCDFVRVDTGNVDNIVGSCNGLVCLSTQSNNLTIWNPSTGKAHNLSCNPTEMIRHPSILDSPTGTSIIFGFGYDSISNDYKIMAMKVEFKYYYIFFCTGLWVYSLKTKLWTISSSSSFPSKKYRIIPRDGVFASNTLHWIMERQDFNRFHNKRYVIGAFDLGGDNQFYEIQPPDYSNFINVAKIKLINLGVLNGCLCVCSNNRTVTAPIDIWVMKEYGAKESWTRLISFLPIRPDFNNTKKLLAYSRCGDKVMILDCSRTYSNLIWYDLKTKNITRTLLLGRDWHNIRLAEVHMYSLVDPNNYK